MSTLEAFFADLDRQWPIPSTAPVPLHLIGSTALMLQTSYARNTKDGDVLESSGLRAVGAAPEDAMRLRRLNPSE